MVSTVIKSKNCKERLSNKKEISHRKSSKSTKNVKINLKVDASVNSDIAVMVKFRNNTRRTTFSEAAFECPWFTDGLKPISCLLMQLQTTIQAALK